ncbi:nuclear/nucleolar GTPase 2 [Tanacetum coccineum]
MLVAGSDMAELNKPKGQLPLVFEMKDRCSEKHVLSYVLTVDVTTVEWESRLQKSITIYTKSLIHLVKNLKVCSWEKLVRILISVGSLSLLKILGMKSLAGMFTRIPCSESLLALRLVGAACSVCSAVQKGAIYRTECDLTPLWVTKRLAIVSLKEGEENSLLSVLRQFLRLKSDKQAIYVGFDGYPNVGKSSVINTLRTKNVCKVAPIPGETKVWQYITLTKKIFLIYCPGVVYGSSDTETDIVLKVIIDLHDCLFIVLRVRVTNLHDATEHIGEVLQRVNKKHLLRAYKIKEWEDENDFLVQLCKLSSKLLRQRGKIPFFVPPPKQDDESAKIEEDNLPKKDDVAVANDKSSVFKCLGS